MRYLFLFALVMAGQALAGDKNANCIIADDAYPFTVTQCTDGTVTVVNRADNTVKVCSKLVSGAMSCQNFSK